MGEEGTCVAQAKVMRLEEVLADLGSFSVGCDVGGVECDVGDEECDVGDEECDDARRNDESS